MTVSTRLRGKEGLYLSLKAGSATAVTFDDVKSYENAPEERDSSDLTFAEAAEGTGYEDVLTLTFLTSHDAGSLYRYARDHVGEDVVVILGPHGNLTPSATKPHYTGTGSWSLPPAISNEARTEDTGAETSIEIRFPTPLVLDES